ncbi:MAG: TerC family protein [Sandaracinaceae bacterium]
MDLLTIENLVNLVVLVFLQAVLGFDNLLYISIESKRAPEADRSRVRRVGIILAIVLRIVLLVVILAMLDSFDTPFWQPRFAGIFEGDVNFATVVFLFGGAFVIYTAIKEIRHMLEIQELDAPEQTTPRSANRAIAMIVVMNLVFSFDSILSAVAITRVVVVLAIAIITSGVLMMVLADRVADFLHTNKKYEVLGLFILLIVGVVLLGEAGHAAGDAPGAHIHVFGFPIEPMSKATFYFSIVVLVIVDVLQSGYQKKLAAQRARETGGAQAATAASDA